MALYEALGKMPGLTVRRDHSADNQLPRGRGITYLHLAASRLDWTSMDEELLKEVEGFVAAGGRLVIAFVPESFPWGMPPAAAPPPAPGKKKTSGTKPNEQRTSPPAAWGFEFSRVPLPRSDTGAPSPVEVIRKADLPLPEQLAWHSPMVFTNLDQSWQTIYTRGPSPGPGGTQARARHHRDGRRLLFSQQRRAAGRPTARASGVGGGAEPERAL